MEHPQTQSWLSRCGALLAGVVDRVAERERTDFDPVTLPGITGLGELIAA